MYNIYYIIKIFLNSDCCFSVNNDMKFLLGDVTYKKLPRKISFVVFKAEKSNLSIGITVQPPLLSWNYYSTTFSELHNYVKVSIHHSSYVSTEIIVFFKLWLNTEFRVQQYNGTTHWSNLHIWIYKQVHCFAMTI